MVASERKLVVAGLVTDEQRRVLITQRRADQAHPLEWEFPGGKIERGESPEQALVRELAEEIGASVSVGAVWDVLHHDYGAFEVLMLVYHCRLRAGESVRCVEVADLRWCDLTDIDNYPLLPADRPLIERLLREGFPAWPDSLDP